VLILMIAICVAGFMSIRGTMPFMPVFGTSMEPELHAGTLILIKEISPSEVKEGDIIVFSIPAMVREAYNYPPVIAHRVINVRTDGGIIRSRTKGDNTGEDQFAVRPEDLKGTISQQIPYLSFPLFFQSHQGLIFIIVALCLLTRYLYAGEIGAGRRKVQRGNVCPGD